MHQEEADSLLPGGGSDNSRVSVLSAFQLARPRGRYARMISAEPSKGQVKMGQAFERFGVQVDRTLLTGLGLGTLVLALYGRIFLALAQQWWNDPNYGHGFLVPVAALYFAGRKKDVLARLTPQPFYWGLAVILGSQAVLLVGFLGAELFLQRSSFLLLLAGSILFLYGWPYVRALAFPLFLLLFMVPLPAIIFNAVALPLQLIASQWAEAFLQACQVPVLREGNILILARQTLNVTEACSGIRSLISLLTLALVVAHFLPASVSLRGLFVLSTLPITLLTNSLRITGTGLLSQVWGEEAARGFFHTFSGWLVFLLAFALLCSESVILKRWWSWRRDEKEEK